MIDISRIGRMMAERRAALGLSQKAIVEHAAALGLRLSRPTISAIETGSGNPTVAVLAAFAKALGTQLVCRLRALPPVVQEIELLSCAYPSVHHLLAAATEHVDEHAQAVSVWGLVQQLTPWPPETPDWRIVETEAEHVNDGWAVHIELTRGEEWD